MSISAKDVKELRDSTGAGMMDCKKALAESNGDLQGAIDYLRTKGLAKAAKKAGRVAAEGLVGCFVTKNGKEGAMVEINCETDFVAKNDDFKSFVQELTEYVAQNNFASDEDLLNSNFKDGTLAETITNLTLKIGEKIALRRFQKVTVDDGYLASYSHGGKIGVLLRTQTDSDLSSNGPFTEAMKNICMHVAASDTRFVNSDEIDEGFKNKEAEIYAAQLKEEGKPENMIDKIVQGKLNKMASEICLMNQKFVMNPDQTVAKYIEEVTKDSGNATIKAFTKFTMGEGIEKKEDNLADEVAKMTRGN